MKVKFADICIIKSSKRIFENEYVDDGVPFIRGQEISDGSLLAENATFECYISHQRYNELKNKYGVPVLGDILITSVGTIGNLYYVDKKRDFYFKDGNVILFTSFSEKVNSKYLYYYMRSPLFKKQLEYAMIGAVQKALTMVMLNKIEIDLPTIEKQNAIVRILEKIDSKISNNNKINAELESMAKTLYDYWFLQFEFPNEEGKPYKSSGGKMVWNEELKREIPEGWKDGIIGDLGEIIAGGTPSTKNEDYYTEDGIAWITPNDLSNTDNKYISHGERDITEVGLKNSSAKLMPRGTVLLTSRAPIGYIGVAANEICTNQGFKSIVPYKKYGTEFVYYTIKTMIPYIKLVGSGSTFTEVSKEVVEKIKIVLPDTNIILKYNSSIEYMAQYREKLEKENKELTELRDFILPLLMNGQVGFNGKNHKYI